MPVTPTYPGVYIEEVPSSVRPIAGVQTSIGAFIDDFRRGPRDAAVQLLGMSDFERVYGGLSATSEASYAIQQFFLNGGTGAWVVRVCEDTDADPQLAAVTATGALDDDGGTTLADLNAGRRVRGFDYDDPGAWGNGVRIDVDYATSDPTASFNLTVSEVVVDDGRARTARSETFRNLVFDATDAHYVLDVVNEASAMLHLALNGAPAATDRPAMTGTISGQLVNPPNADVAIVDVTVTAGNTDTFTSGAITVPFSTLPATATWDQARGLLEAALQGVDPTATASRFLREASVQVVEPVAGQPHLRVLLSRSEVATRPRPQSRVRHPGRRHRLARRRRRQRQRPAALAGRRRRRHAAPAGPPHRIARGAHRPVRAGGGRPVQPALHPARRRASTTRRWTPSYRWRRRTARSGAASCWWTSPPTWCRSTTCRRSSRPDDTLRHRNLAIYWPRPQIADPLRDGPPALHAGQRHDGRPLRADGRRARRVEGARGHRGGAARRLEPRLPS